MKDNLWYQQGRIIVVGNNDLKQGVISLYHKFSLAGHPGAWCTFSLLGQDYWWLNMKQDIKDYVKGCTIYQSTKPRTNVPKAPLHPITVTPNTAPFKVVNINFIMKLPLSKGYDLIMTIVDHDCPKAAIFIPCNEQMDILGTVELYAKYIVAGPTRPRCTWVRGTCRLCITSVRLWLSRRTRVQGRGSRYTRSESPGWRLSTSVVIHKMRGKWERW